MAKSKFKSIELNLGGPTANDHAGQVDAAMAKLLAEVGEAESIHVVQLSSGKTIYSAHYKTED